MNPDPTNRGLKLPNTIAGRAVFALFCLVVGPPAAMLGYGMLFIGTKPTGVEEWTFHLIAVALCTALTIFSGAGLTWATIQPSWSEKLLIRAVRLLCISLFVFCIASLPYVLKGLWTV